MPRKVERISLPTQDGPDAVFEASYLEEIPAALDGWAAERVLLVVSTTLDTKTEHIKKLENALSGRTLYKKTGVGSHSPYRDIIDIAHKIQDHDVQAVVSIGSGSYSDACKIAVMLASTLKPGFGADEMEELIDQSHGLAGADRIQAPTTKLICVPTSLSAGEWNAYGSGTNSKGKKQHFMHPNGAPSLLLLDPRIASTTPSHLWLASGVRAIDHFVESLCNPMCTEEAAEHIKKGLPILVKGLAEYNAGREDADEDELLKGITESQHGARDALIAFMRWKLVSGPSHAIGHQLGSSFGVQHGVTSCVILPSVLRFTKDKTQEAQSAILKIFNDVLGYQEKEAADALRRFIKELGLPTRLSEVGVTADEDLDKIADMALTDVLAKDKGLPDKAGMMKILDLAR